MAKSARRGVVIELPKGAPPAVTLQGCAIARIASVAPAVTADLTSLGLGIVETRSTVDPTTLAVDDEVLIAIAGGNGTPIPVIVGRLRSPGERPRDVRINGRRILLKAEAELVLKCASATVRIGRDGEVSVRGERVVTQARRANKVRGGSVEIN